jgi:hypothetical protein
LDLLSYLRRMTARGCIARLLRAYQEVVISTRDSTTTCHGIPRVSAISRHRMLLDSRSYTPCAG